jgi:hypothetical protein
MTPELALANLIDFIPAIIILLIFLWFISRD